MTENVEIVDSRIHMSVITSLTIPSLPAVPNASQVGAIALSSEPMTPIPKGRINEVATRQLSLTEAAVSNSALPQRLVIPVMRAQRMQLVDNLEVLDDSGRSLVVLSHLENQELARLLIVVQAMFSSGSQSIQSDGGRRWWSPLERIPYLDPLKALEEYAACFSDESRNVDGTPLGQDSYRLRELALSLCYGFFLSVEVFASPGDPLLLKLRYDQPLGKHQRRLWGPPRVYRFDIPLAKEVSSYHFQMTAPKGFNLRLSGVVVDPSTSSSDVLSMAQVTTHPNRTFLHFYAHGLHKLKDEISSVSLKVMIYERLPGSLAPALIFSLATTAVLVLLFITGIYTTTNGEVHNTDIAVIFVTLVGTLALWLRSTIDRTNLFEAPLASRLGLFFCAGLAYASGLLMIVDISDWSAALFRYGFMATLILAALETTYLGFRLIKSYVDSG